MERISQHLRSQSKSISENHNDFPSLEQLLSRVNETQQSGRWGWSDKHIAGNFRVAIKNDYNEITALEQKQGENKRVHFDSMCHEN